MLLNKEKVPGLHNLEILLSLKKKLKINEKLVMTSQIDLTRI